MDYEKKYKNAIKSILEWREKYGFTKLEQYILGGIFSELKESEDERIRKDLIKFIKGCGAYSQEYVDWLEKLGDIDNKFIRMRETKPKDISEFLDRLTTVEQEFLWEHIAKIKKLDKKEQSERKSQEKSAFEAAKEEKVNNQNCIKPADKIEPKFRIEKGKWYVCTNTFVSRGKIIAIKGQTYQSQQENDTITCEDNCLFIDRHDGKASDYFRYWTIKDAKDGDMLCCESGWTCIFKTLGNDETFSSYCFMDKTKRFYEIGSECHTLKEKFVKAYSGKIYPATKEQRDLLFLKMKEAGYEWDAEKKKLKKIELKPADNIPQDFEKYVEHLLSLSDGEGHGSPAKVKEVSTELLRLANRQKSAWSEEDEKTLNAIALFLSSIDYLEDPETWINWLKSIKDRITPLPIKEVLTKVGLKPYKDGDQWCILLGDNIQEGICGFGNTVEDALYAFLKDLITSQSEQEPTIWSEEDEKVIHLACEFIRHRTNEFNNGGSIGGMDYKALYKKLESIRLQNTWKPSEEQMSFLKGYAEEDMVLQSLYNDLKKLKE